VEKAWKPEESDEATEQRRGKTLTPALSRSTGRGGKRRGEGDARQLALEVVGEFLAIAGDQPLVVVFD
jgi:hypothetical protein